MQIILISTVAIFFSLLCVCKSQVFDTPDIDTTSCEGSLAFTTIEDEKIEILSSNDSLKIHLKSVTMKGCGCFKIFEGKNRKRSSAVLSSGRTMDREILGFNTVKSVLKIDCLSIKSGAENNLSSFPLHFFVTIVYLYIMNYLNLN